MEFLNLIAASPERRWVPVSFYSFFSACSLSDGSFCSSFLSFLLKQSNKLISLLSFSTGALHLIACRISNELIEIESAHCWIPTRSVRFYRRRKSRWIENFFGWNSSKPLGVRWYSKVIKCNKPTQFEEKREQWNSLSQRFQQVQPVWTLQKNLDKLKQSDKLRSIPLEKNFSLD